MMNITIIGTGYVGLVTGACLAELGNHVLCLDIDPRKIDLLNAGGIPIFEPGLQELVARNKAAGRLRFTTDTRMAAVYGAIQFIAVGTPPDEDGSADLQYVLAAAAAIGTHMPPDAFRVIVNKSTVPVGTADKVRAVVNAALQERGVALDAPSFSVVSNPEFLKEGAAIDDFMRPDRIVLGTYPNTAGERALALMRELYAPFTRNHDRILGMDVRSAEFTKYAANAMLATRISFMNELANLADVVGVDIEQVRKGIGSDPRIGTSFLYAGCGYGGSCFPKDVQALQRTARQDAAIELEVLGAVERANARQKRVLFDKIVQRFGADLRGKHFALWGLAFKPNTDDMREASSLVLIAALLEAGASIRAYDPVAMDETRRILGADSPVQYATSAMGALEGADALVIVTEWKEFRSPDFIAIRQALQTPCIFDGRNLYEPHALAALGLNYFGIGRQTHSNQLTTP